MHSLGAASRVNIWAQDVARPSHRTWLAIRPAERLPGVGEAAAPARLGHNSCCRSRVS